MLIISATPESPDHDECHGERWVAEDREACLHPDRQRGTHYEGRRPPRSARVLFHEEHRMSLDFAYEGIFDERTGRASWSFYTPERPTSTSA